MTFPSQGDTIVGWLCRAAFADGAAPGVVIIEPENYQRTSGRANSWDLVAERVSPMMALRRTIHVGLPPERAIRAFTPVGERAWVHGWDPFFPGGERGDGAEPGTVFITEHHGTTVWIVANRGDHSVRYARVTPGHLAGLVEVCCSAAEGGGTTAEVGYELTALSDGARPELERFTAGYDAEILTWEQAIADAIAAGRLS